MCLTLNEYIASELQPEWKETEFQPRHTSVIAAICCLETQIDIG